MQVGGLLGLPCGIGVALDVHVRRRHATRDAKEADMKPMKILAPLDGSRLAEAPILPIRPNGAPVSGTRPAEVSHV